MFKSATIRLTIWYLAILMIISLAFSAIIYQITSNEIERRLERFQTSLQAQEKRFDAPKEEAPIMPTKIDSSLRDDEQQKAQSSIIIQLAYVNFWVLVVGGFSSYFLARHHLRPIEKAHAAQSRFTSDASHELRTPLAAMKTEIEVSLKDKNATNDELRETLSSNLEEVNKLTRLSSMLLNLSRMDDENLKFDRVNLNDVTKKVVEDFRLPKNRIEIIEADKNTLAYGHETAIFDLIKILLDNAIKYSKVNSKIWIRLGRKEGQAFIEVKNTGIGITKDKIDHIFERFYRADPSRTNNSSDAKKSYGLGLALAKKIVDLHHGKIIVKSIQNETTTFTVLLPNFNKIKAKVKK